jgi:hypothetical protein
VKLHEYSLHTQFAKCRKSDEVNEDEMAGHVARTGKNRNLYSIVVGNPERKGLLGRPRISCSINVALGETGRGEENWTALVQDM